MAAVPSQAMANVGSVFAVTGMISGAIGSYYSAKTAQYQVQAEQNALKSKALSIQYQADVSELNGKSAQFQAMLIMRDRNKAIANMTLKAGQERSSARAAMASRGLQLDIGSSAEVMASMDYVKEADMLTINSNAVRSAENAKITAVNAQANAMVGLASAGNVMASMPIYSGPSAAAAAVSGLLGGVGGVASSIEKNPAAMEWLNQQSWFK
jgi:hypothetical protein